MANVGTGFSCPYVAEYSNSSGTNVFSNKQVLARGVSVSVSPDTVDDNNFYADNIVAETENGAVSGGTITLTVDGLSADARRAIYGLPAASGGWTAFGDDASTPYMAVGFLYRTMNNGATSWWAVVFPKCRFRPYAEEFDTQEAQIDWQTLELTADFMRDDTSKHNWKYVSETGYSTEAAASAALQSFLTGGGATT